MKKTILSPWLILALIWSSAIFVGTCMPMFTSRSTQVLFGDLNKTARLTAHIGEFFILGLLLSGVVFSLKIKGWKAACAVLGVCLLYALFDEFHQFLTPGRDFRWIDVGKDTIGTLLAIGWLQIPIFRSKIEGDKPKHRKMRVVYYA